MKEQASQEQAEAPLKLKTARTLKWNTIDRLASQVLYGVVGVVLPMWCRRKSSDLSVL